MRAAVEGVLGRILEQTQAEVLLRRERQPLDIDRALAAASLLPQGAGDRLQGALSAPGVGVIAEFKRRSPSAGALHQSPMIEEIVPAYQAGGAVAVSVLTEGPNFEGALQDLVRARELCSLALLRKDFILDPYQLIEARTSGADAVLLIVAALEPAELASLHAAARELALDVLVEVHDERELDVALAAGARVIGVNNRDLRDFSVDIERTRSLMGRMPDGVLVVSESGISSAAQVRELGESGVAGVLVGESLMRSAQPAAALRELRGADHGPRML